MLEHTHARRLAEVSLCFLQVKTLTLRCVQSEQTVIWSRPGTRVAVQCEMTRHSCWIRIKNKRIVLPELKAGSLKSNRKAFQRGSMFTHAHKHKVITVCIICSPNSSTVFYCQCTKEDTQSERRDKHSQTEGESRPNTFEEFTRLSVKPLRVCRKQISRTH